MKLQQIPERRTVPSTTRADPQSSRAETNVKQNSSSGVSGVQKHIETLLSSADNVDEKFKKQR